jgi:hypothetical protein
MRALCILLLVGLVGCASPKHLSIQISRSDKSSKVKILGEFSHNDYENAQKSLKLLNYLAPDLVFTNSPKISWIDSKEFAGITLMNGTKEILIDKEFKIKNGDNLEYFDFLRVYVHELCHFERGMTEPEVNKEIDERFLLIYQNQYQKILNYNWK